MRGTSAALLVRNFSLIAVCVLGFAPASHACDLVLPVSELMTSTEAAPSSIMNAVAHVTMKSVTLRAYRLSADQSPMLIAQEKVTPAAAQEKTREHAAVLEIAKKTGCVAVCQTEAEGMSFKAVERGAHVNCR